MKPTNDHTFKGAGRKFLLEINVPGFSMHDDDFVVILKQATVEKTFNKSDLIEETTTVGNEERHNFYLCFDSDLFERGVLTCIVKAFVPDTDFPNGIRVEIDKFDITIIDPV